MELIRLHKIEKLNINKQSFIFIVLLRLKDGSSGKDNKHIIRKMQTIVPENAYPII